MAQCLHFWSWISYWYIEDVAFVELQSHILHMSGHMGLGHCPLTLYLNWMNVHFHAILPSIATSTPAHLEYLGELSVIFPPRGGRGDPWWWREALWPLSSRPEGRWELHPLLPSDCAPAAEDVDASYGGLVAWRNHGWSWGNLARAPWVGCCLLWAEWGMIGWWSDDSCNWLPGSVFDGMTRYDPLKFVGDSATRCGNRMGWYGIDGDGKSHLWLWTWRSSSAAAILMWLGTRLQSGKPTPN